MKNNNNFRLKRTVAGVSCGLLLLCNSTFSQDQTSGDTFTLNLKNTDIHSLISTVSKQTGKNFVVDPRVKAKVTVISTDPVSADGLYEVFLSVLQVHGYSAVPAGDLTKIVPDVTAKQGPVPILGDDTDSSDQLVTQVVPVINVPAAQLVPILRPMVPQQGHLAAYAATNSLIITDRSSNIQRLMEIIRRIDKPDNEEIEVVRLNHAAASEIVRTLTSLQRNNLGGPQGPGATQMVADERTNSVLISGDRAVRVRMRGLIAHLDTPIESGGNTRVVYLRFANAEDMVSILQGVSQGQAKVGTTAPTEGGASTTTRQQPVQQQQPNNAGNVPTVPTQLGNDAVRARSAADSGESNVDIQADPNTNSLIITAPPDEMQNILAVIRQLDIRRAQVLVEAVIAEITEDNTREFGINFLLDGRNNEAPIGISNLGDATSGALGIAGALDNGTAPSSLGNGVSLALGRFGSGNIDFGFLVRAIASDADNNILSTPSLMTLDNEEAEIVVGSNVPFVTGTQLSANNNNPFQTIERRDIGLTLKVKPQINDGNSIKMELEQEVSDVNTTALTGASDITTSKRSIKTTVLVEDGQTLVLGGLIDDKITDVEEKVPLLGDIPIIGNLFRYRSTQKSKQNLMIFLHPVIIRDAESATQFSNSKYNFLRSQQTLYRQRKDNNIRKEEEQLPELRLFFKGQPVDSPLTRFDDLPSTSSDPIATTADIDTLAGFTQSNTITPITNATLAQSADVRTDTLPEPAIVERYAAIVSAEEPLIAKPVQHAELKATDLEMSAAMAPGPVDLEHQASPTTTTGSLANPSGPAAALVGRVDKHTVKAGGETPSVSTVVNETENPALLAGSQQAALTMDDLSNRDDSETMQPAAAKPSDLNESDSESTPTVVFTEIVEPTLAAEATAADVVIPQATAAAAQPPEYESTPDTDEAQPDIAATAETLLADVDNSELIAMANIWRLGITESSLPDDSIKPEVEIVSIKVVDATGYVGNERSIVSDWGSVQLNTPVISMSGTMAGPGVSGSTSLNARY